jgi:capsular exopolysaccharide synthesis family protein
MRQEITIGHDPKNEIISIACTTQSPALSSRIANALVNDYVVYLFQMRYGSTQRTSRWLTGQLDDLKRQIEQDQNEITDLQRKLGVIGFDEKSSEYLQTETLDSMTKAASAATIDRIMAEAKLRYLKEANPDLVEGEVNILNQGTAPQQNSLLMTLRNAQADTAANYARLTAQFGANYPEVQQVKAELDQISQQVQAEEQRVLNQADLSYKAAASNEQMTQAALRRRTNEAFDARSDMVRYVLLLHDYDSHRALYEALVERLREATMTSGLEAGEVDIVDLADLPALPNPPGPLLLVTGSAAAGLLLGCLVALAVNSVDTRIGTAEQAERASGLPLLTVIPHHGRNRNVGAGERPGFAVAAAGSAYAESIQSLRSSILLALPGKAPRVVLITSGMPGEGKTTTARNLAAAFARHRARVLLIDCDLRNGPGPKALGGGTEAGLTNVLTGHLPLRAALQEVEGVEGLSQLTAGPRPPDPAVLTASAELAALIHECVSEFDFVILDSSPLLGLPDTVNLAQTAEAVVLVIREKYSSTKVVQRAVGRLTAARAPLTGFALNDVDLRSHAYSEGYGYGHPYRGYTMDEIHSEVGSV